MALLNFFLSKKRNTANIAKERLQIIIAERRTFDNEPNYIPQLKIDILNVICKHVKIDPNMVKVSFDKKNHDITILELNVIFPKINKK